MAFFLLTANLVGILTADTIYGLQLIAGTYQVGNFLDAIWLCGNLALGAAALHPTMTTLSERAHPQEHGIGPVRIAASFAAALVAPATLVIQFSRGQSGDVPLIAGVCGLLFVLTIVRMAMLVSEQRRMAITDGLTGLHTRRFFEAQLPIEVARARRTGGALAVFLLDVDHFKSINDRFGHPVGDQALAEIATKLRETARAGDVLARYGGEEFALLVPDAGAGDLLGIAERIQQAIASSSVGTNGDSALGVTVSIGAASYPLHGEDPDQLVAAADRALYAAKAQGRDRSVVGEGAASTLALVGSSCDKPAMIDYLSQVADEVDALLSNHEHSRAIGRWTRVLAMEMGYDKDMTRRVELAGRLHDVGKIIVPESILIKPGALTDEEWELMRQHPDSGYRLARVVPGLSCVAEIIRQHHERYDGRGYPARLAGTEIRSEARVLAVCDSWAAMRSDRPYQSALNADQAREQLRLGRGSQFDPDVVDLFLDLHHKGAIGELRLIRPASAPISQGAPSST
jgi:two-component system cell cycle response regulator